MRPLTSVDAQNRFGEMLDTAQREPVEITRRGRPVAVVVSPREYQALAADRSTVHSAALAAAARAAVAAFRGSGSGGGAARLVADRQLERSAERPLPAAARRGTRRA